MEIATRYLNNVSTYEVSLQLGNLVRVALSLARLGVLSTKAEHTSRISLINEQQGHVVAAANLNDSLPLQLRAEMEFAESLLFDANNAELSVQTATGNMNISNGREYDTMIVRRYELLHGLPC